MTQRTSVVDCTRRDFLRAGLVSATSLSLGGSLLADAKKAASPAFAIGAQSYTFRHFTTEQTLKKLQDLGLHSVEFYQKHAPLTTDPEQIKALLKLCAEYDVKPVAWGVQHFSKDHEDNRKYFEFAKALGVKGMSADPNPDSFDSLDKLCEEYKLSIGIHPHGPQGNGFHRWYSAEVIMKAVKDHHPLIGACLDTGHLLKCEAVGTKLDPAEQIRIMGARNFGIHLKDHDNKTKTDVVFGKGALDVGSVLTALKDVKFAGWISIEYEANEQEPTEDVKACVAIFQDALKKLA